MVQLPILSNIAYHISCPSFWDSWDFIVIVLLIGLMQRLMKLLYSIEMLLLLKIFFLTYHRVLMRMLVLMV